MDLQRIKFRAGKQKNLITGYMEYKGCSSQREMADFLGINRSTLKNWVNENLTLPKSILDAIYSDWKEAKKFNKFIITVLPGNWGKKKGGNKRKKDFGNIKVFYKKLRISKEKIRKKKHKELKKSKKIRNTLVLHLIKEKIDLKSVLATYLLTDGSLIIKIENYRLAFYTKDEILKDFIYNVLYKESQYIPSIQKDKKQVYAIRVSDKDLSKKLLKINPSFKKKPTKNQDVAEYLREMQPSLKFLKKANKKTREFCIRLAFSTDGYISPYKNSCTVALTCYHPFLPFEWAEILNMCGMESSVIKRKNSWCGLEGVRLANNAITKFWKIGGFIPGVRISSKSKTYKGMEKNTLLRRIVKNMSL